MLANDITFGPWLEQKKGIIKGSLLQPSSSLILRIDFFSFIYFTSAYYGVIGSDGSYSKVEIL